MQCIFCILHFFVQSFLLLTSNWFHISIEHADFQTFIQIVNIHEGLLEGQLDQTGRYYFRNLSSTSEEVKKPLESEEQCLKASFNRPVAPPLDLSFYGVDYIFSLFCL